MRQAWADLLFLHWPVEAEALRKMIPPAVTVDTFDGQAWIGIVPFEMQDVCSRFTPPLPWLSKFCELNVRTYVRVGDKSGVSFLSLDGGNPMAVELARLGFCLPYYHAQMSKRVEGDWIYYSSTRTDARGARVDFQAAYRPAGDVYYSRPGTLEHWLTERYCFFAEDHSGQLACGEVHHSPWPLQPAKAIVKANTMLEPYQLSLQADQPLLHFSRRLETFEWPIARVDLALGARQ